MRDATRIRDLARLIAVLLGGCGASAPSVELGTGAESWAPIVEGAPLPIVRGLQGGYHLWGAVRVRGLSPAALRLRYTLTTDGGVTAIRDDLVNLDADGAHAGTQVFLPDPAAFLGQPCRLDVEALDTHGLTARDARHLIPEGPLPAGVDGGLADGAPPRG